MSKNKQSFLGIAIILFAVLMTLYILRAKFGGTESPEIRQPQNEFAVNQNPKFSIVYAGEIDELKKNTSVYSSKGEKVNMPFTIKEDTQGKKTFVLEPGHSFRPGRYKVVVQDGKDTSFEQNFSWGVLAVNTDKPSYLPGENARLELAVLDENGDMVCDAAVVLQIKDPVGNKTILRTESGEIKVNPECNLKDFTLYPDYETTFPASVPGTYQMILNAKTKNGEFSIQDTFYVKTSNPFQVRRKTATRIYPPKRYPVTIEVTADRDFKGTIEERVPLSFQIFPNDEGIHHSLIKRERTEQLITWETEIKKGETKTLTYTYDAPDLAPQFYLLGPLTFYDGKFPIYKEERIWQIASDAVAFQEVQSDSIEGTGITSLVTGTLSGVADDLYLAAVATKPENVTISSISGLGLTWTLVKDECSARNQTRMAVYKAQGTPSGNGAVTVNFNSFDGGGALAVARYNGVLASGAVGNFDAANTDGVDSAGTDNCDGTGTDASSYSFSTLDTSQANSMVFSAVNLRSRTHTPGTGYTERIDLQSGASGDSAGVAIQDKTFAATTSNLTVDGTFSGSPLDFSVVALEIKIAAAATNTPTPTATPTPAGPNSTKMNGIKFNGIKINFNWPFLKVSKYLAQS